MKQYRQEFKEQILNECRESGSRLRIRPREVNPGGARLKF